MASRKDVRDFLSKLKLPSGAVSQFNEPDLLDDLLDHCRLAMVQLAAAN